MPRGLKGYNDKEAEPPPEGGAKGSLALAPKGQLFFVFLVTPEGPKGARRGGIYCQ